MLPTRPYRRRITLVSSILVFFLLYHFFTLQSDYDNSPLSDHSQSHKGYPHDDPPDCPPLPGMEDILVVLKTGVTEAPNKVPVHFHTSFRCIPNYVIYSDFAEDIAGVRIHDALRNIDPEVRRSVPDFDLYNRLREHGRAGLAQGDFADEANSAIGKPNNPGWKLDKWKFLPMVTETLAHKPDAKWYVFMEADTYYFWPNLLAWLDKFDPRKPWYIGTETQIADVVFAHGGSGFIVSRPALERAVEQYATRTTELNTYTNGHWAGDCVLGKVLLDAGVGLHFSWPLLQNSNLGELDEFNTDLYRKPWCFPAIALHHLTNEDIKDLYRFEHERWLHTGKSLLLHSDIFKDLIHPQLPRRKSHWDNLSSGSGPEPKATDTTFEDCLSLCEDSSSCVQFTLKDRNCFLGKNPRLGVQAPVGADVESGWLLDRVQGLVDSTVGCSKVEFG